MPKQISRRHAANRVHLQVSFNNLRCRDIHQVVDDVADDARLRGKQVRQDVELRTQARHDTVLRRLFSRKDIDSERAVVRASLAQAAAKLTPERLERLGSPGRRAVQTVGQAARLRGRHDVKAGRIRSAVKLLAGKSRWQSFLLTSPARPGMQSRVDAGLQPDNMAHRAQLTKFCGGSTVERDLLPLLCARHDMENLRQYDSLQTCILMFKSVALDYLMYVREAKGGDEQKKLQQLWKSNKRFLQLFLQRWAEARQDGRIGHRKFDWVEGVEWLVGRLQAAECAVAAADASPAKSPRIDKRLTQAAPSLKAAQPLKPIQATQAPQSAKPPGQGQPLKRERQPITRSLQTPAARSPGAITGGSGHAMGRTFKSRPAPNARLTRIGQRGTAKPTSRTGRAGAPVSTSKSVTPVRTRLLRQGTMENTGLRVLKPPRQWRASPGSPSRLAKAPVSVQKAISPCLPANTKMANDNDAPVIPGQSPLKIPALARIGKLVSWNAIELESMALSTNSEAENLPEIPPPQ